MKKNITIILICAMCLINMTSCVQVVKDSDNKIMLGKERRPEDDFIDIKTNKYNQLIDDEFDIYFNDNAVVEPIRLEDNSYSIYDDKILVYNGNKLDNIKRKTPVILEYKDDKGYMQRYMHTIMLKKDGKTYLRKADISEFLSDETLFKASESETGLATKSVLKKVVQTKERQVVRLVPKTTTVTKQVEMEISGTSNEQLDEIERSLGASKYKEQDYSVSAILGDDYKANNNEPTSVRGQENIGEKKQEDEDIGVVQENKRKR